MPTSETQNSAPNFDATKTIPTEHELLPPESVESLDRWMLNELASLERRFGTYVTAESNKTSCGR